MIIATREDVRMPTDKTAPTQTTDAEFVAAWRKTFAEIESAGGHISHSALAIKRMLRLLDTERERCAKIANECHDAYVERIFNEAARAMVETDRFRVRIIEVLAKYHIALPAAPLDMLAMSMKRMCPTMPEEGT